MKSVVKKDDAVSPVIGTILLVAITVVLVAIVAAVVMGMVGGQQTAKDVGFTVAGNNTGLILTPYGGKDLNLLTEVIGYNATSGVIVTGNGVVSGLMIGVPEFIVWNSTTVPSVGNSHSINLVGTFSDGTTSVIYKGTIVRPTV